MASAAERELRRATAVWPRDPAALEASVKAGEAARLPENLLKAENLTLSETLLIEAVRGNEATIFAWLEGGGHVDARCDTAFDETRPVPAFASPRVGATLLHGAAIGGHAPLVRLLLQRGANPGLRCPFKWFVEKMARKKCTLPAEVVHMHATPLGLAVNVVETKPPPWEGHISVIRVLLASGAGVHDVRHSAPCTVAKVLHWADHLELPGAARQLRQHRRRPVLPGAEQQPTGTAEPCTEPARGVEDEEAYLSQHASSMEHALSQAVNVAIAARATEPLLAMAAALLRDSSAKAGGAGGGEEQLRRLMHELTRILPPPHPAADRALPLQPPAEAAPGGEAEDGITAVALWRGDAERFCVGAKYGRCHNGAKWRLAVPNAPHAVQVALGEAPWNELCARLQEAFAAAPMLHPRVSMRPSPLDKELQFGWRQRLGPNANGERALDPAELLRLEPRQRPPQRVPRERILQFNLVLEMSTPDGLLQPPKRGDINECVFQGKDHTRPPPRARPMLPRTTFLGKDGGAMMSSGWVDSDLSLAGMELQEETTYDVDPDTLREELHRVVEVAPPARQPAPSERCATAAAALSLRAAPAALWTDPGGAAVGSRDWIAEAGAAGPLHGAALRVLECVGLLLGLKGLEESLDEGGETWGLLSQQLLPVRPKQRAAFLARIDRLEPRKAPPPGGKSAPGPCPEAARSVPPAIMERLDRDYPCRGDVAPAPLRQEFEAFAPGGMKAMRATLEGLNAISAQDIGHVKALKSPPQGVKLAATAVALMLGKVTPESELASGRQLPEHQTSLEAFIDRLFSFEPWPPCQDMMADAGFLRSLIDFDKDTIEPEVIERVRAFIAHPLFDAESIGKSSTAAKGMAAWALAFEEYDRRARQLASLGGVLAAAEWVESVRCRYGLTRPAVELDGMDSLCTPHPSKHVEAAVSAALVLCGGAPAASWAAVTDALRPRWGVAARPLLEQCRDLDPHAVAPEAVARAERDHLSMPGLEPQALTAAKDAAMPILQRAVDSAKNIKKEDLSEAKSLAKPTEAFVSVFAAVMYLLAPKGVDLKARPPAAEHGLHTRIHASWPPLRSPVSWQTMDVSWGEAKKELRDAGAFVTRLLTYDKDNLRADAKAAVRAITGPFDSPTLTVERMQHISAVGASMLGWVINMCLYSDKVEEIGSLMLAGGVAAWARATIIAHRNAPRPVIGAAAIDARRRAAELASQIRRAEAAIEAAAPGLPAALEALKPLFSLGQSNFNLTLGHLIAQPNAPPGVQQTAEAVCLVFGGEAELLGRGVAPAEADWWMQFLKRVSKWREFAREVQEFDIERIGDEALAKLQPYCEDPALTAQGLEGTYGSNVCVPLMQWVRAVCEQRRALPGLALMTRRREIEAWRAQLAALVTPPEELVQKKEPLKPLECGGAEEALSRRPADVIKTDAATEAQLAALAARQARWPGGVMPEAARQKKLRRFANRRLSEPTGIVRQRAGLAAWRASGKPLPRGIPHRWGGSQPLCPPPLRLAEKGVSARFPPAAFFSEKMGAPSGAKERAADRAAAVATHEALADKAVQKGWVVWPSNRSWGAKPGWRQRKASAAQRPGSMLVGQPGQRLHDGGEALRKRAEGVAELAAREAPQHEAKAGADEKEKGKSRRAEARQGLFRFAKSQSCQLNAQQVQEAAERAEKAAQLRREYRQALKDAEVQAKADEEEEQRVEAKAQADAAAALEKDKQWSTAKWVESLGLHGAVAEAVAPLLQASDGSEGTGGDAFLRMQALCTRPNGKQELEEVLRAAGMQGLTEPLWKAAEQLSAQRAGTAAELASKFVGDGSFQLAFGGLELFFKGLEGLIGSPRASKPTAADGGGPPTLLNTMRQDHRLYKDANLKFTTSNGIEGATPAQEWEFVFCPMAGKEYAERGGDFRTKHRNWCRRALPLQIYEARMAKINERLTKRNESPLILEELVGGRLYTGPMFAKYNSVLRWFSKVRPMQDLCVRLHLGEWAEKPSEAMPEGRWVWINKYTTTIHAINSCVLKAAKLTRTSVVYRGFQGLLPSEFWEPDDAGIRGGVEFGFTSTTTERAQALHYSAGKASTVFEMRMGMVDRGASLRWLSQYPHEAEILFAPLLGLEALGAKVDRSVLLVEVALSSNMNSLTLEQVVSKRQKVCVDMAKSMQLELSEELKQPRWEQPQWILSTGGWLHLRAAESLGNVQKLLEHTPPEVFNDDDFLAGAFKGVVGVRNAIANWPDQIALLCVEPMQAAAGESLSQMTLPDLAEIKSLRAPPAGVKAVFECARLLLATNERPVDTAWEAVLVDLMYPTRFLHRLATARFDTPAPQLKRAIPFMQLGHFNVDVMMKKSKAAAGLMGWCRAYIICQCMLQWLKPKQRRLDARRKAASAQDEKRAEEMELHSDASRHALAARAQLVDADRKAELPESGLLRMTKSGSLAEIDDAILQLLRIEKDLTAAERASVLRSLGRT